jgi:hypothetical protein
VPRGRISSASGVPGLCGHHRRGAGRLGSRCCSSRGGAFRGRLACHLILADRQPGQNVASAVTLRTFRICRRGGNSGLRRRAPNLHYCTGQGGTGILRGSHATNHGAGSDLRGIDTTHERTQPRREQIAWGDVGARQEADLAELADWVEGLRAAAHTARAQGNITLAEALDVTRFEVYEGYLDEELDHKQSQAAARRSR